MKTSPESAGNQTPEELVAQINRLMEEAEALLVGPIVERTTDKFSELRAGFRNAQARLGRLYGQARHQLVHGAKRADKTIRAHPYESLAVALGAGVLLGVCFRRTRR